MIKNLIFEVLKAFEQKNAKKMRKLNDKIVNEAVIHFSQELYNLGILSYMLSKILSKPRFSKEQYKRFREVIRELLEKSIEEQNFMKNYHEIIKVLKQLDDHDRRFVISLTEKGKLKVAATLYAQGISLGLVNKLTNIEKQEILSYVGKTMMFDRLKHQYPIEKRMKIARRLIE